MIRDTKKLGKAFHMNHLLVNKASVVQRSNPYKSLTSTYLRMRLSCSSSADRLSGGRRVAF